MSIQSGRLNPPTVPKENTFCADGIEYCHISIGPHIVLELDNSVHRLNNSYIASARRLPQQLCNMEYGTLKTYNYEGYSYHCRVSNSRLYADKIVYLALAKTAYSPQTVFSFLREVDILFDGYVKEYSDRGEKPIFFDFLPVLKEKVVYYSGDPTSIKIRQIREDAAEVKDIMIQNIDEVAKRGESLKNIADKTSSLTMKSKEFRSAARKQKRTFWWRNKKFCVALVAVVIVLILALLVILTIVGVIPPIWKWFGGGSGGGGKHDPKVISSSSYFIESDSR